MGRPTVFTPQNVKRVTDALRLGATYKMAAQYGGVSYDALNDWINNGIKAEKLAETDQTLTTEQQNYYQFYQDLKKAEAEAVLGWLAKIEKEANEGNWQAAAWKLERRYPRDYSRNVTEVVGDEGGPVKVHFYLPSNGRDIIQAAAEGEEEEDDGLGSNP